MIKELDGVCIKPERYCFQQIDVISQEFVVLCEIKVKTDNVVDMVVREKAEKRLLVANVLKQNAEGLHGIVNVGFHDEEHMDNFDA